MPNADGKIGARRLNDIWTQRVAALRHLKERKKMAAMNGSALTLTALLMASVGLVSPASARGPGFDQGGGEPPFVMQFDMIDTNKDGKVTVEEMTLYRQSKVAGTDANADGKLSADEIAAQEVKLMSERAAVRAAEMVERFDADGDGLLSAEELAARPMPGRMFDRLDSDGDGAVSREEADAAMTQMSERRGERRGGWMRHWGMNDDN